MGENLFLLILFLSCSAFFCLSEGALFFPEQAAEGKHLEAGGEGFRGDRKASFGFPQAHNHRSFRGRSIQHRLLERHRTHGQKIHAGLPRADRGAGVARRGVSDPSRVRRDSSENRGGQVSENDFEDGRRSPLLFPRGRLPREAGGHVRFGFLHQGAGRRRGPGTATTEYLPRSSRYS